MTLRDIRERWEKATKGPWSKQNAVIADASGKAIADGACIECHGHSDEDEGTFEFIAHSWYDIEFLLSEVERLQLEKDEQARRMAALGKVAEAAREAMGNLGVPQPDYPAPIAYAYRVLDKALWDLEGRS